MNIIDRNVRIITCDTQAAYDALTMHQKLGAAFITVGGKIVKNKLHPDVPADNAIAIAEEAFRAAFMAGATKAHRVDTEMATEADWVKWTSEAWSEYKPSEHIKDLTT